MCQNIPKCTLIDEFKKCRIDELTGSDNDIAIPSLAEKTTVSAIENPVSSDDYNIYYLEQLSLLQALRNKERQLKIAILHAQYIKEDLETTDEHLLSEKIAELQDVVKERKAGLKMADTMFSKKQLADVLQKVISPFCKRNKNNEGNKSGENKDEEIQRLILGLTLKKKEIEKEISLQQQEIADLEEKCLQLKTIIDNSIYEKIPGDGMKETKDKTIDSKDNEELKRLEAENKKRNNRIQLLSKILHILIMNMESESLKDDLEALAYSCKNILNWDYNNIDEIEELCKSVYSTTI